MIKLFNHENSPVWAEKNKRMGLQNGAKTYSEAITKWYWPVFHNWFKDSEDNIAVITVTTENNPIRFSKFNKIYLFLHECSYMRQPTVSRARRFKEINNQADVIFIVWSETTAKAMQKQGLRTIFLPMAIDLQELSRYRSHPGHKFDNRIIYYGNLRGSKRPYVTYLITKAHELGWEVDYISDNAFNGDSVKLSREEIFYAIQQYKYGAGVGICAHEMSAFGLKVFLYAYDFKANCPYTEEQARHYIHNNLCSMEEANILIPDALRNLGRMHNFTPVDVAENAKLLEKLLQNQ